MIADGQPILLRLQYSTINAFGKSIQKSFTFMIINSIPCVTVVIQANPKQIQKEVYAGKKLSKYT